jgi:hypothetical protein
LSNFVINPYRFGVDVGAWKLLGRNMLTSSVAEINFLNIPDKRYYMILTNILGTSAAVNIYIRLGNASFDSGTNYAWRKSEDGGTDTTGNTTTVAPIQELGLLSATGTVLGVTYCTNLASNEKLLISHSNAAETTGASTAPHRSEIVSKWVNTSNVINQMQVTTAGGGGGATFDSGSEVILLGWSPEPDEDSPANNFWQELASVELGSAGDTIDSGIINAKKYLWVQLYTIPTGSANVKVRFNSDSSNNYALRLSENGGSEITAGNNPEISSWILQTNPHFYNMFIVNNSATEKLLIGHIDGRGTTGASNPTNRQEFVGKWVTTGSQITNITANNDSTGSYDTGSFIKVWGHD